VDHHKRAVVVSIRGTLSLRDCLVDASCEDEALEIHGIKNIGENYVHKGIWLTAQAVLKDIEKNGVLKRLQQAEESRDYDLVIVGHSLGAGTASLLSVMLRKDYPEVRCWAFSPPGGLLTLQAAVYCQKWITSVIVGDDMISRLSRASLEHIFDRVIYILENQHSPKCKILCCSTSVPYSCDEVSSLLHTPPERHVIEKASLRDDPGLFVDVDLESHTDDDSPLIQIHKTSRGTRKLFPPGRIMWLMKEPGSENSFVGLWKNNTNFPEIIVSKGMMTCHLPDFVYNVLSESAKQLESSTQTGLM